MSFFICGDLFERKNKIIMITRCVILRYLILCTHSVKYGGRNMERQTECQMEIKKLRESTGMNRKEFCETFDIPYRTVTEWERGTRNAPEYVLRLLAYYIRMENMVKEKEDNNGEDN